VNCTVYFRENGSSKIYSLEQAKGRVGSYGIRWQTARGNGRRSSVTIPPLLPRN